MTVAGNQVDIWIANLDQSFELVRCWAKSLSHDELIRADRFNCPDKRHQFLVARIALRSVLARYLASGPEEIEFSYSDIGKPGLVAETDLSFNLSHSHWLAVIAVSRSRDLGIDIEYTERQTTIPIALKQILTTEELRWLTTIPLSKRSREISYCWVYKEAYYKAFGQWPHITLDATRLSSKSGQARNWTLDPIDDRLCWNQYNIQIANDYVGALVLKGSEPALIRYQRWPDQLFSASASAAAVQRLTHGPTRSST